MFEKCIKNIKKCKHDKKCMKSAHMILGGIFALSAICTATAITIFAVKAKKEKNKESENAAKFKDIHDVETEIETW